MPNAAGTAASALHQIGFAINGTADAATFSYTTSVIQYAPGNLAAAETLLHHLNGATELQLTTTLASPSEVVLIVGTTYQGVAG